MFLDKDKSKSLSIEELTRGLTNNKVLTAEEVRDLFVAVDYDKSNSITYDELIRECSKIHCAYIQSKIKSAIESDKKLKIEEIVKTLDSNKNGELEITEFN